MARECAKRVAQMLILAAAAVGLSACPPDEAEPQRFSVSCPGDAELAVHEEASFTLSLGPSALACEGLAWVIGDSSVLEFVSQVPDPSLLSGDAACRFKVTVKAKAPGTAVAQAKVAAEPWVNEAGSVTGPNSCEFVVVGPDAGLDAGRDAAVGDGAADAPPVDAPASDAVQPDLRVCTNIVAPELTYADPAHPSALVCNAGAAVAEDGQVAGLAYASAGTLYTVDGVAVSACVRVDFASAQTADEVRVVARAASSTCGDTCLGDVCGTFRSVHLFGSADGTSFTRLGYVDVGATLQTGALAVGGTFKHLLACRGGGGHGRDNIEVDYVALCTF
jgi:hypothetical protein